MPVPPLTRDQMFLLPPNLGDLIPEDHPVRFVADFRVAGDGRRGLDGDQHRRRHSWRSQLPSAPDDGNLTLWLCGRGAHEPWTGEGV